MQFLSIVTGLVCLCASSLASSHDSKTPQFHNSANHPGADPHVIYDSKTGQYFAYSTEGADPGSLFAIYSSPDLSTWHKHPGGVLKACYDDDMNRIEGGQACWARDWYWAPETYYNEKTGWYFFFFAGRLREDLAKDYFRYSDFEEPSKIGLAVSKSPIGPFREIKPKPIEYYPFDPDYYDVNLIMDEKQMRPPQALKEGKTAPKGTYIPTIDVNIFFDKDGKIYLYLSRNAYRNWNWDKKLGKYIEESNIIVVEMERDWWDDPKAMTMPEIIASQKDIHAKDAPKLPQNITSYNGTGEIGSPPRKDGWKTVISYGADPQDWENYHVDDYEKNNGTKKDRRWAEASNYGVGFATSKSPFGPFRKSTNNPILSQKPDAEIPIYSTGHGSIVASPAKNNKKVGAQDVTLQTPPGSELFYVHHARNSTERDRSIYTTRMNIDQSAMYFGSDDAMSMTLTSLDQPLPKNTYPIHMDARCSKSKSTRQFRVKVTSHPGASFDILEGTNRVVALPGNKMATSIKADKLTGSFLMSFGSASVKELAYQRLSVGGSWSTVTKKKVTCR
ncbi:hypothetical protein NXS19_003355 [Fusarium pseudograminearum]|nr:hypothetical protein NXS19_003355 [Fusarium pseudograminearum]